MEKQHGTKGQTKQTGASDIEYDIVSEMHSLLKGNQALEQYIRDAQGAGDTEAETCFKAVHDQNKENVQKLRQILAKRLGKAA